MVRAALQSGNSVKLFVNKTVENRDLLLFKTCFQDTSVRLRKSAAA